jgi:hypothetical protein
MGAGQAGVTIQVFDRNGAVGGVCQPPVAIRVAFGNPEQTFAEIALDGAHVDAMLFRQAVLVEALAAVQSGEDMRQPAGQFLPFAGIGSVLK